MIKLNGEICDAAGQSLAELLRIKGYDKLRIAVGLNGDVAPRNKYADIILKDGDEVDVLHFMGGG